MSSVVETLEAKLLVPFENLAKRLTNEFPNVQARAYSTSVGSLTEYQGHLICVDCLLTDASHDETDNVALCVDLAYLTTHPKINADVVWGHPSGHSEADFFSDWQSSSDWLEVSDETLESLYADLPRLCETLIEAVRRRKPSNE